MGSLDFVDLGVVFDLGEPEVVRVVGVVEEDALGGEHALHWSLLHLLIHELLVEEVVL